MEINRRHLTPTSDLCTHTNGHTEAHISHTYRNVPVKKIKMENKIEI